MRKGHVIGLIFILMLVVIPFTSASFEVKINPYAGFEKQSPYYGESNKLTGSFRVDVNAVENGKCTYECTITLTGTSGGDTKKNAVQQGIDTYFEISDIKMISSTYNFEGNVVVSCSRTSGVSIWCNAPTFLGDKPVSNPLAVRLSGIRNSQDSTCDYNDGESCANNPSGCKCSGNLICDLNAKDKNNNGCTSCGNRIADSSETCSTCPQDVGKCDGLSCTSDSECKGKNCVWSVCSSTPYRLNDGHCDKEKGENCVNSLSDCSCKNNEECNRQTATCEMSIYCGDGECQLGEEGNCAPDCDYCGNQECKSPENCEICSKDCGECKNEKINLLNSNGNEECSSIKCWRLNGNACEEREYSCSYATYPNCPKSWIYTSKEDCEIQKLKEEVKEEYQKATDKVSSITGAVISDGSQNKKITIIVSVVTFLLVLLVLVYVARKMWGKDEGDKRIKKLEKIIKKHTKKSNKLKKE